MADDLDHPWRASALADCWRAVLAVYDQAHAERIFAVLERARVDRLEEQVAKLAGELVDARQQTHLRDEDADGFQQTIMDLQEQLRVAQLQLWAERRGRRDPIDSPEVQELLRGSYWPAGKPR